MNSDIVFLGLFLFVIACLLLILAVIVSHMMQKQRQRYRIPKGKIAYADLNQPGEPLFSPRYRLVGKPDYIVKTPKGYYPVEFKMGRHDAPMQNHVMQLAAYCHLVEEQYGGFVSYGLLVYNDNKYQINYDPKLRFELEHTIKEMRTALRRNNVVLNHSDMRKCGGCSMRRYCSIRLA
jgi:CRISPR-associated exonuclease Cas4